MIFDPADLPPSVIAAAEVLVRAIEISGVVPPRYEELDVETKARGVAFMAVVMYHPEYELSVQHHGDG